MRRGRRTRDDRRVAAERLEPRCLLSGYTFVKITDSTAYSNLGDHPALSENGQVAFRASGLLAGGTFNIVAKGTGAPGEPITTIETDAGPYFQFGEPSINATGTVVFWAAHDDNGLQGIVAGDGTAAATTLVIGSAAAATNEFEQLDRLPDINDSGDIAFMGDRPDTTGVFHLPVGGAVTMLVQESDGYQPFTVGETFVSFNNADGVSFNAKLTGGDKVIAQHTGPGGVRTNLRDASGVLDAFSRTSISQDGDVLSSVSTDAGAQSLIRYSNAGVDEDEQVVAANPGFAQFDSPNLTDNIGGMVFRGVLSGSGMTGIYTGTATGSDPVANKVIENGNTLDGKVISTLAMSSNAANSVGQIAFFVSFTDGSSAIYRADPVVPPVPVPTTTMLNIPTFATEGTVVTMTATVTSATQGGDVPTGNVDFVSVREVGRFAFGADVGFTATVRVLNESGATLGSLTHFPTTFLGGVRVALGDVTGDGVAEIIAAQGPGGDSNVHIFSVSSGGDGGELQIGCNGHIAVPDPLNGTRGLNVAAGDVNGDGFADIVVSGGPKVFVYSGKDFTELHNLTPFGTSISEIRVAVGDVNGDGVPDVITGTGPGVAPSIKVFNPLNGNVLTTIAPFESTFRGGVFVAAGDVTGDGIVEILAAKGPGSLPQVKVFNADGTLDVSFMAFADSFRGGVRVNTGDLDGDGIQEMLVAPALGTSATTIFAAQRVSNSVTSVTPVFDGTGGAEDVFELQNARRERLGTIVINLAGQVGLIAAARTNTETVVGTAPLDEDGVATFETDDLEAGVSSIDARFNGSAEHDPSTSGIDFIEVRPVMDFGDAPSRYGTLFADDGPRHRAEGPMLGSRRDAELDGQPSLNADFDDTRPGASDDEDGVTFMSDTLFFDPLHPLATTVIVEASERGILDAYIDYNRDGQFDRFENLDNGLNDGRNFVVEPGRNLIRFYVPEALHPGGIFGTESIGSVAGSTIARFRISSLGGLGPTGEAEDGEVEDYRITLRSVLDQETSATVQLPSEGPIGAPEFASFDVFVNGGLLSLAGVSSGGDRSPLFQMPFDGRQRLEIMGTAGDDTLRLDLSNSNISFQDFHFDGGGEATALGDSIEIIGGSRRFNEISLEYDDLEDGLIELDSTRIEFADLEPIRLFTTSDIATLRFTETRMRDLDAVLAGTRGNELRFSGTAVRTGGLGFRAIFEQVTFLAPRESLTINLTSGSDELRIQTLPASMASITINVFAGAGNDLVQAGAVDNSVRVLGESGRDTITGGAGNDLINGGSGNDVINAGGGADTIYGESGDDVIDAGSGANTVYGGEDNDILRGGVNGDFLFGDAGNDLVHGGAGGDFIEGGNGEDQLYGELGNDFIHAGSGSDTADGGSGDDLVTGDFGGEQTLSPGDLLIGGDGNDTLEGTDSADDLRGGDGHDLLLGGNGEDQLLGNAGNDSLSGGTGTDIAFGHEGNDVLNGETGDDLLDGGTGNDSLDGGDGGDQLDGRDGDDSLTGGAGVDIINGDVGADTIQGGAGADLLRGGIGNDSLQDEDGATGSNDTLEGGAGDDLLHASAGSDFLLGGAGNDSMDGGIGVDTISGEDGNDTAYGGAGADGDGVLGGTGSDLLIGGGGDDTMSGDDGDDILTGGDGNDSGFGGDGNDRIFGDLGDDNLLGGDGRDSVDGGGGHDILSGEADEDSLNGGAGNDILVGSADDDSLLGGDGDDLLEGGDDNDVLRGGNGNDTVRGQDGNDVVQGQGGNDTVNGGTGLDVMDGGAGTDVVEAQSHRITITRTKLVSANDNDDDEIELLTSIEKALLDASFSVETGSILNASGFKGSVTLFGNLFNDTLTGGSSSDSIDGGRGNDSLTGGAGNDSMQGNDGLDTIKGGDGNDSIKGGEGNDSLLGEKGNDTLNGGAGNDTLDGGDGDDGLSGFTGDDSMLGGIGNDTLIGGVGKDTMLGGAGNDICLGKENSDSIKGEAGADTLAGGSGGPGGVPDAGDVVTRDAADLAAAAAEAFVFTAAWIDEI